MANKYRGEVTIRLDRTRTLKLDFNAFADFQTEAKTSLQSVFLRLSQISTLATSSAERTAKLLDILGESTLRIMLWAALRHDDEELTIRQAGELIEHADGDTSPERFNYVLTKISEAYAAQLGGEKKEDGGEPSPGANRLATSPGNGIGPS